MTATATDQILTSEILDRFGERAATYDRDNRFFYEDFEDLRRIGYLTLAVPIEFGGRGLVLSEVLETQRRLAYRAPSTALAVNMHLYWTGVAADLHRSGDCSLDWILEEAAAGEVFAAGHSESGNDLPLLLSTTRADPVAGGYRFAGRKMFASLTPVWTRLGIHGMDISDPASPRVVHGFLSRETPGYRIKETWDTLGMRATRSDDTILDSVFIPAERIARVLPAGEFDQFIRAIFAWGILGFGTVYFGLALRARDLAVDGVQSKRSLALGRSLAYHPEIQHLAAEMTLAIEGAGYHLDQIARDWSAGIDHRAWWPAKIVAAKYHAVEAAKRVVDLALEVSGGTGMFRTNELERLYRDVRCGGFHPANSMLTHEIVGKTTLGIELGEQPRWG